MPFKKILFYFLVFSSLYLLETGFLFPFGLGSESLNLIVIFSFLLNYFGSSEKDSLYVISLLAGFFLDIISGFPMGISTLIILSGFLLTGKILKNLEKNTLFAFTVSLLAFFISYSLLYFSFSYFFYLWRGEIIGFEFNRQFLSGITYNITFGFLLFLFIRYIFYGFSKK